MQACWKAAFKALPCKSWQGAKLGASWGKKGWDGTGQQKAETEIGPAVCQAALGVCHNFTGLQSNFGYTEDIFSLPNQNDTKVS